MATCVLSFAPAVFAQRASDSLGELLTGNAAYGDWRTDAPLVRRKITDLPPPYATRSASNPPRVIAKPVFAAPNVPPGFQVELFASNLRDPRTVRVAPNGDIFITESEPGRIRVLRAADGAAKPSSNDVFASGLDQPFGIAFYPSGSDPQWIYVANTGSVVRYPYRNGDLKARGKAEVIVRDLPGAGGRSVQRGHITRDIAFSKDGRQMFVSVGSASNDGEGIGKRDAAAIARWEAEHGLGSAWGKETVHGESNAVSQPAEIGACSSFAFRSESPVRPRPNLERHPAHGSAAPKPRTRPWGALWLATILPMANKCLACLQQAHASRIIGCGPVQRDEDSPGAGD